MRSLRGNIVSGGTAIEVVTLSGRCVKHLNVVHVQVRLDPSPIKPGRLSVTVIEAMPGDDGTITHYYNAVASYLVVTPPEPSSEPGFWEGFGTSMDGVEWTDLPRPPCGVLQFQEAQLGYPAERIARALDAYADEDGSDD